MATIHNSEAVRNQVGGNQNVHGSVFLGTVNNITNNLVRGNRELVGPDDTSTLDKEILSSLAFPEMFERRSNVETAHKDTCTWIFDTNEFRKWTSDGGLLWVKGKPGAGKSTLMSFLYQDLGLSDVPKSANRGTSLDFFFHGRGSSLQRTPYGMLRALLNQMLRQNPDACSATRTLFKDRLDAFGSEAQNLTWHQGDLERLLMKAVLSSVEHQPLTVFIDALDEAGEKQAREVARYFHHMNERITAMSQSKHARICMSSRHYPIPSLKQGIEVWVENHNRDDISRYVHDCLSPDDWTCDDEEWTRWSDLQSEVVRRSNGIFQWTRLVVQMLEQQFSEGETAENCHKWLQRVPQELEDVYEHILRHVVLATNLHLSYLLFQWVCLAERPVTVTELRYAIALNDVSIPPTHKCEQTSNFISTPERMKMRIKSCSGGLIETILLFEDFDDLDGIGSCSVQVIHQSVNDYMLSKGLALLGAIQDPKVKTLRSREDLLAPSEIISRGHAALYWSCLKFFVSETVGTDPRSAASCKNPMKEYALRYMFVHAQKAARYRSEDLSLEYGLLTDAYSMWHKLWDTHILGPYESSDSSLCYLAYWGLNDLIEWLVQPGDSPGPMEPEVKKSLEQTALHFAAGGGHLSTIRKLLYAGANIDAPSWFGTPVFVAVTEGHLNVVKELVAQGASFSCATYSNAGFNRYILHNAVSFKRPEIVSFLLDAGVDVNCDAGVGEYALTIACGNNDTRIAELLLEKGADVNLQDATGLTALMEVCRHDSEGLVRMLLARGADVNKRDKRGRHALAIHCDYGMIAWRMVKLLADAGADVNIKVGKSSLLQKAISSRRVDRVRFLVAAGADLNPQQDEGLLPLMFDAANPVRPDPGVAIMRCLLEAGADPNLRHEGRSLLQFASEHSTREMVDLLLEFGADAQPIESADQE